MTDSIRDPEVAQRMERQRSQLATESSIRKHKEHKFPPNSSVREAFMEAWNLLSSPAQDQFTSGTSQ